MTSTDHPHLGVTSSTRVHEVGSKLPYTDDPKSKTRSLGSSCPLCQFLPRHPSPQMFLWTFKNLLIQCLGGHQNNFVSTKDALYIKHSQCSQIFHLDCLLSYWGTCCSTCDKTEDPNGGSWSTWTVEELKLGLDTILCPGQRSPEPPLPDQLPVQYFNYEYNFDDLNVCEYCKRLKCSTRPPTEMIKLRTCAHSYHRHCLIDHFASERSHCIACKEKMDEQDCPEEKEMVPENEDEPAKNQQPIKRTDCPLCPLYRRVHWDQTLFVDQSPSSFAISIGHGDEDKLIQLDTCAHVFHQTCLRLYIQDERSHCIQCKTTFVDGGWSTFENLEKAPKNDEIVESPVTRHHHDNDRTITGAGRPDQEEVDRSNKVDDPRDSGGITAAWGNKLDCSICNSRRKDLRNKIGGTFMQLTNCSHIYHLACLELYCKERDWDCVCIKCKAPIGGFEEVHTARPASFKRFPQ